MLVSNSYMYVYKLIYTIYGHEAVSHKPTGKFLGSPGALAHSPKEMTEAYLGHPHVTEQLLIVYWAFPEPFRTL